MASQESDKIHIPEGTKTKLTFVFCECMEIHGDSHACLILTLSAQRIAARQSFITQRSIAKPGSGYQRIIQNPFYQNISGSKQLNSYSQTVLQRDKADLNYLITSITSSWVSPFFIFSFLAAFLESVSVILSLPLSPSFTRTSIDRPLDGLVTRIIELNGKVGCDAVNPLAIYFSPLSVYFPFTFTS